MQNIKLLRIVAADIVCTMIAQEVVQFAKCIRKVDIADSIDNIETFTRMKMVKVETVALQTFCGLTESGVLFDLSSAMCRCR